jgi:hypothetical protein
MRPLKFSSKLRLATGLTVHAVVAYIDGALISHGLLFLAQQQEIAMKSTRSVYVKVAAAAVALAALGTVSVAQARSNVFFSVNAAVAPGVSVGIANGPAYYPPVGYVQPAYVQPVYVQPQPVYVQPQTYYQPAPVYVQPAPIYYRPAPVFYGPAFGVTYIQGGRGGWDHHRGGGHGGHRWHGDRDGRR